MKECVFCNIIKNGDNNGIEKNIILFEDDLVIVSQATGSPVRGYLMIIIKKHINGFAELSLKELEHVEKIINIIKIIYKKHFNINSILLEHGSTEKGRHSQSIVHAHLHLIPFNFNQTIEEELKRDLCLKSIKSFKEIRINKKMDYWLYCDPNGEFYSSANILDAPRSIFMNLIAKQLKMKLPYEWRKSVTPKEYINEMIEIFKKNEQLIKKETT